MFRIRLSDLNLMVGMGWAEPDDAPLCLTFDSNEADGGTVRVRVGDWEATLGATVLPSEPYASFDLGRVRDLVRFLRPHYKNQHAILTFNTLTGAWTLSGGPGNGRVLFIRHNH